MMDFITGWILGKNSNKIFNKPEPVEEVKPMEVKQEPKVYKYAPIPDLYDYETTLEESYQDYKELHLVVINRDGHNEYYLEVYVPVSQTKWGQDDLIDFI